MGGDPSGVDIGKVDVRDRRDLRAAFLRGWLGRFVDDGFSLGDSLFDLCFLNQHRVARLPVGCETASVDGRIPQLFERPASVAPYSSATFVQIAASATVTIPARARLFQVRVRRVLSRDVFLIVSEKPVCEGWQGDAARSDPSVRDSVLADHHADFVFAFAEQVCDLCDGEQEWKRRELFVDDFDTR